MLNLWQHLNKLALFLILTVTTLTCVPAYELSASPAELTMQTSANTEICREILISSSSQRSLMLETVWSSKKSRTISDFTQTPEELGINVRLLVKNEKAQVCITTPDSYAYYGLVLINSQTYRTTIGIWLTINPLSQPKDTPKNTQTEITPAKITGKAITSNTSSTPHYEILVGLCTALLLATLLIWLYKKSKDNKRYAP